MYLSCIKIIRKKLLPLLDMHLNASCAPFIEMSSTCKLTSNFVERLIVSYFTFNWFQA